MARRTPQELLSRFQIISDQVDARELGVILRELDNRLVQRLGAVVELGCYVGTTSLFIRRILDSHDMSARFDVYDSFEGLPPKTLHDISPAGEHFRTGELSTTRRELEMNFTKAGLRKPKIHKGGVNELTPDDMPDDLTFAYLDGDYYESIRDSLRVIEKKLLPGSVIVVDDYANEALPGAAKAVDEWMAGKLIKLRVESSLAILYMAQ
ncbi:hypothetical protein E6P97_04320 [Patescibacteria group bacterium]|nr:MAG: hypothetical protein E6P97_04320 [Patescibacteria group bacterium]